MVENQNFSNDENSSVDNNTSDFNPTIDGELSNNNNVDTNINLDGTSDITNSDSNGTSDITNSDSTVTLTKNNETKKLKLNYKRTFLVAFAFFGILLMWQVYDNNCSKLLEQQFLKMFYDSKHYDPATNPINPKNVQFLVGLVMALDNLAALIMMPIFGKLSDKTHSKLGKRMPYILIGTVVCAIAFPFIPLCFHYNQPVAMILIMAVVVFFAMMYRNPAVALMPDMTPKPLRSKANGIINIVGYIGGLVAMLTGLIFVLTRYLEPGLPIFEAGDVIHAGTVVNGVTYEVDTIVQETIVNNSAYNWGNPFLVEMPFIIASIFMLISVGVLLFTIKENKIAVEVKDEMEEGEKQAELVDRVDNSTGLSKTNRLMLILILVAEFFWFMADNGISTFLTNYSTDEFHAATTSSIILTIVAGAGSVIGFAVAPIVAGKIGRKWTLTSGLTLTFLCYFLWMILTYTAKSYNGSADHPITDVPWSLYPLWFIKGFGMSLVHVNSFPMVVELCTGDKIGKFTGYYYASSMAAQTVTPTLLGLFLLIPSFSWKFLPIYATICGGISLAIFFFVPNVKLKKTSLKKGLEALDAGD